MATALQATPKVAKMTKHVICNRNSLNVLSEFATIIRGGGIELKFIKVHLFAQKLIRNGSRRDFDYQSI